MLLNGIKQGIPFLALLVAIAIWGVLPTLSKIALSHMSVLGFLMVRFVISSILLSPFIWGVVKKARQVSVKMWLAFGFTISLMFYSQTWAISEIPASIYIVLFSVAPVVLALCLRYRMNKNALLGVLVVAVSLFVFLHHGSGKWSLWGIIGVLIGMLCWVVYSVLVVEFHKVYNDVQITALTSYCGAFVNIVLYLIFLHSWQLSLNIQALSISAIIGLVLPVAFFGYSYGLRHCPRFSVFGQYLEPVFGLIVAVLVFGGELTVKQYIAFVFILLGVFLVTKYSSKQKEVS